jgi:hypothetical protein
MFSDKILYEILISHACYISRSSHPHALIILIDSDIEYEIMKLLIMQFPPTSCHSLSVPNIFLRHPQSVSITMYEYVKSPLNRILNQFNPVCVRSVRRHPSIYALMLHIASSLEVSPESFTDNTRATRSFHVFLVLMDLMVLGEGKAYDHEASHYETFSIVLFFSSPLGPDILLINLLSHSMNIRSSTSLSYKVPLLNIF